jgi:hypothetical protein
MSLSSSELLLPQADKASARHEETAAVRHSRKKADGIEELSFVLGTSPEKPVMKPRLEERRFNKGYAYATCGNAVKAPSDKAVSM